MPGKRQFPAARRIDAADAIRFGANATFQPDIHRVACQRRGRQSSVRTGWAWACVGWVPEGMPDRMLPGGDPKSPSDAEWLARLAAREGESLRVAGLGADHSAVLARGSRTLIVSFEEIGVVRARYDDPATFGLAVARERGWSSLTLVAMGATWFRDPAVYAYFDRLVDRDYFEDFDRILFFGAGMGGYAAAAYSVVAPGATVLAIQPQATLDPRVAGWDARFIERRRLSFTDRYGFAPAMIEAAQQVFILYDPDQALDAMHAAMFARDWVTLLPCPHLGRDVAGALDAMGILVPVVGDAARGALTVASFRNLYRARRNHLNYLSNLLARLDTDGRPLLAALLCRNVAERLQEPRFMKRLAELEGQLDRAGIALPAKRG